MSYEKQLDFKQEEVYNNIKRIGGIENFETVPILGSKNSIFIEIKWSFLSPMPVGLLNMKSVLKKISE
jgi:23S rRNA (uracil1939-C5)-methyltransferase